MLNNLVKIKSILLIVVLLILSVSCRSDGKNDSETAPKYFIKANFNGQSKVFNYRYGIGKSRNSQGQVTSITMSFSENNPNENIYPIFFLKINEPVGASGSQQNITISPRTFNEQDDNVVVEFYKTSGTGDLFSSKIQTQNDFYVTITELGTSVKGTFSGSIENLNGDKIVIENGEFYTPVAE